jgi:glycosyltransferase involved in cell wall biosynthesis
VVPEDVAAFAGAVTEVLRTPELQRKLAREGASYVATQWTSTAMAKRLLRLYSELVAYG